MVSCANGQDQEKGFLTVIVVLVHASARAPHMCQKLQVIPCQIQKVSGNDDCKFKHNLQDALERSRK